MDNSSKLKRDIIIILLLLVFLFISCVKFNNNSLIQKEYIVITTDNTKYNITCAYWESNNDTYDFYNLENQKVATIKDIKSIRGLW